MHLGHGEPQEQHSASREGQDLQRLGLPARTFFPMRFSWDGTGP